MFSSPFSSRTKTDSQELKLLQDQIKSLQEMYIGACEARDDLQENMQSLKSSLKLKADEAEHSGARVRELELHSSQLTQRLRDATDLLERRGVAERVARDELRRLEADHNQGASTYLEQLDNLRQQIRDAEEALQRRQREYESVRLQLGVTERVSEAGMAQIRQLASLLSQQQQQLLPPFLSQLQSPAPRVVPSPSPCQSAAASHRTAGGERGEAARRRGDCDKDERAQPCGGEGCVDGVAAVCLEERISAADAAAAASVLEAGTQQPVTPPHRPQSPALVLSHEDDAEGEGLHYSVSGSSDESGSDA